MTAALNPKPFRPIQCRRLIATPKGANRQQAEAHVRAETRAGCRLEDGKGSGRPFAVNKFLYALQVELLHSEGWGN